MQRTDRRGDRDRFEVEKTDFFRRVRQAYLQLAEQAPDRFAIVDCSMELARVQAALGEIVMPLLVES